MTGLRDQPKAGLSAATHQPNSEAGPSLSELADKIKALKAINTIEATPQRARQKHSTAEEPITARIRRRQESTPASDQAGGQIAASEAGSEVRPAEEENSPGSPPMSFQERIVRERQQNGEGEGQGPG